MQRRIVFWVVAAYHIVSYQAATILVRIISVEILIDRFSQVYDALLETVI